MTRLRSGGCGLAAVMLLALPATKTHADHLRNVEPGQPVPPIEAEGLDGKAVSQKDLAGKVVVVVYVSARQTQSEEALASAHRVFRRIANADLALVYMSADVNEGSYFRQLRDRVTAHEPFALDADRRHYGRLGLIVLPTTIVASKEGKLLHVIAGWTRNYEHHLELYCHHALGELDDEGLAKRLAAGPRAVDKARTRAERHRAMAAVLRKKGMADAAIRELEQATAAVPGYPDAVVDIAEILIAQDRVDDAEKRVRDLIAVQPDFHRAKLVLGAIKLKRGRLDEAEKLLTEALLLNPDPVRTHYYLGQLYEKKGDPERALKHYRDALERCLNER